MDRKSFLDQEAPVGYVAGLGRGATGFTTQQDIGDARLEFTNIEDGYDDKYQDVSGDEAGLLGDDQVDESDLIYESIEAKLRNKKRKRKGGDEEVALNNEGEDVSSSISAIGLQFQDLKRDLSQVDREQWLNLPESGDFTRKNKRSKMLLQEQQRFYRAPDSVIGGDQTMNSEETDLRKIQLAKDRLLELKLDNSQLAVGNGNAFNTGQNLDSSKYLNDLSLIEYRPQEVGDYQRMKLALANLRKVEPKNGNVWISSARLEEQFKKFKSAKSLISQGCQVCVHSEDVWLENVRLNLSDIAVAKSIVAEGLRFNSTSFRLWFQAYMLESAELNKKRVLQKALENIPDNAVLWFELIKYQDDDGVIRLLQKAVELIPNELSLWLKLISVSPYDEAKALLNKSRKQFGELKEIWMKAFQLCEKFDPSHLPGLVTRGVSKASDPAINWLEGLDNEYPETCKLLISTVEVTVEELAKLVETYKSKDEHDIVRLLYQELSRKDADYWEDYLEFEQTNGSLADQDACYKELTSTQPQCMNYLRYAKFRWQELGDLEATAETLYSCLSQFPDDEEVYFAIVKFENSRENWAEVEDTLVKALDRLGTERSYYKLVNFYRCNDNVPEALKLANEGLTKYPQSWKLHLQRLQMLQGDGGVDAYEDAVSQCPHSVPIWVAYSRYYESKNITIRARSILEKAEILNPQNEALLLEQVMLESRTSGPGQAQFKLVKNLKSLPNSPKLLGLQLQFLDTKSKRKQAYISDLKLTQEDSVVILEIAKSLWLKDANVGKAKSFFDMALSKDEYNGDVYGWYYLFLTKHGDEEEKEHLLDKFVKAEPFRGDSFNAFKKQIANQRKTPQALLIEFVTQISKH
ncbi:unnamed protein product [Kuraishia capsulata CBS 1993]|uniref:PRP1 splicing factor N-terminal domain-containing protein n=1 Tax=Kuraishia capsulata CBS 1993 TaxID=1382522 RepID=W6MPP8_9ASCO|nr:uncharacterized protein KUCA_T00004673001 [Kuraishia capsulata CBS 1993]CDK28689.1 unnamed protein product [Kuraishia capsulata CBS 1993]